MFTRLTRHSRSTRHHPHGVHENTGVTSNTSPQQPNLPPRPAPVSPHQTPADHPTTSLPASQILKIHLLGQPATGDLQRPFAAAPSPFAAFMPDASAAAAPEAVEAKPAETKKAK